MVVFISKAKELYVSQETESRSLIFSSSTLFQRPLKKRVSQSTSVFLAIKFWSYVNRSEHSAYYSHLGPQNSSCLSEMSKS